MVIGRVGDIKTLIFLTQYEICLALLILSAGLYFGLGNGGKSLYFE